MNKGLSGWRLLVIAAMVLPALLLLSPSARADIFAVENVGDTCGTPPVVGSPGGGLCTFNGTTYVPYSLSALVGGGIGFNQLEAIAPGQGTIDFIVKDDFGSSSGFSFTFTNGVADNASCQLKGGTGPSTLPAPPVPYFTNCSITDSLGHTTSAGGTQIGGGGQFFTPPATISFSGSGLTGATFELEFVSMQGLTTLTPTPPVPEPSSLALFGTGLLGLLIVAVRRKHLLLS